MLNDAELAKLDEDAKEEMESQKEWMGDWHPEDFELDEVKEYFDRWKQPCCVVVKGILSVLPGR